VTDAQALNTCFPNLANFAQRDLVFLS